MLFGCVHIPDFPVQALLRVETAISFKADAVAVLDGPASQLKVFSCNQQARRAGIQAEMSKSQAEVLPDVILLKRMLGQEQAAQTALVDCGFGFSPRVESTCPGTIILDLTGSERVLGSRRKIGRQLAGQALACGFEVNVALAANPDTALHAARGFPGTTVIIPGEEAARMARLPVKVLQPGAEVLDTLHSWGIREFQSLAVLPAIPLTQRLGQYGLHLQRLARGEAHRELVPAEPAKQFEESIELEEPVELLEPLAFVINRLLEQLTARLRSRSLATDHLRLNLKLEVHVDRQLKSGSASASVEPLYHRTLKLPVPTQDGKVLLKLLQLDLAAHPPQAPVKKISAEAFPAHVRFGQSGLFQPATPEPARLEVTMARLRGVVGEKDDEGRNRVGFSVVTDSHKPDSFQVLPFSPERKKKKGKKDRSSAPKLGLRLFRPPLPAKVGLAEDVPAAVVWKGRQKKLMNALGPWRSSGSWWDKADSWQRDEWDVEVRSHGSTALYRIFRDRRSGQWFVAGIYD